MSRKWTVSSYTDLRLFIHSTDTGRLITILQLDTPASSIFLSGDICVLITNNAELFSWNLGNLTLIVNKSIAFHMKTPDIKISKLCVSETGIPLLTLNNGEALVYSKNLSCWLAINIGFHHFRNLLEPLSFISKLIPEGMIATIYPIINSSITSTNKEFLTDQINQSLEETQLEALLEAAKAIDSPTEFRFLSTLYLQKLIEHGKLSKLSEVLRLFNHSPSATCGLEFKTIAADIEPLLLHHNLNLQEICDRNHRNEDQISLSFLD